MIQPLLQRLLRVRNNSRYYSSTAALLAASPQRDAIDEAQRRRRILLRLTPLLDNNNDREELTTAPPCAPSVPSYYPLQQPPPPPLHSVQQRRWFHTTRQQNIVPLLAVGAATCYYTYRAITRMESEWDDYRWKLAQYEKKRGVSVQQDQERTMTTVAIDMGTGWTKLAAALPRRDTPLSTTSTKAAASPLQVLITPQGDRATFNGIVYDTTTTTAESDGDGTKPVVAALGKAALERFWFDDDDNNEERDDDDRATTNVILPFRSLADGSLPQQQHDTDQIVYDLLSPLLTGALDRVGLLQHDKDDIRRTVVVTVPPTSTTLTANLPAAIAKAFPSTAHSSTHDSTAATTVVVVVPEPVATVWGAQQQHLLPMDNDDEEVDEVNAATTNKTILVIDIGGWTTQVSLVHTRTDTLHHAVTIPWGGEHMVQTIVQLLVQQAATTGDGRVITQDARSLAAVQMEARQVLTTFASQERVDVLVPYLFPDPGRHNFETQLSRETFHRAVQQQIQQQQARTDSRDAATTSTDEQHSPSFLSTSLPPPNDLQSLWVSALARVLEDAQIVVPHEEVYRIVVVGGGSKAIVVQESLRSALQLLLGPAVTLDTILVWPETMELSTELTVLGAASLPPSLDYSLMEGLVPR